MTLSAGSRLCPCMLAGVMPGGDPILVIERHDTGEQDVTLRVVTNWFEEVREKTSR